MADADQPIIVTSDWSRTPQTFAEWLVQHPHLNNHSSAVVLDPELPLDPTIPSN